MTAERMIVCPACKGTGGPINWMGHPGSIGYDVPCPLCNQEWGEVDGVWQSISPRRDGVFGKIKDRRAALPVPALDPDPMLGMRLAKCPHCGEELSIWPAAASLDGLRETAEEVVRVMTHATSEDRRHAAVKALRAALREGETP